MEFQAESTSIQGVIVLTPEAFQDSRGYFTELFRADKFQKLGLPHQFMQMNESASRKKVIRGLHFQWNPPMGKLMRVTHGAAFLVAVDLRKGSPSLGKWVGVEASAENRKQVWAPASFARGFCALEEHTRVEYLCTGIYNSKGESGIRWNDPDLAIAWPVADPVLSEKDRNAQPFRDWLASPQSDNFKY
jgi:dTDP-4-dehydrorhamnose 3,5-epimerase